MQAWLVVKTIRHILWIPQSHKIRTASSAAILLYFQALQNGVLRAFPKSASMQAMLAGKARE
jgi:hypothetical protein